MRGRTAAPATPASAAPPVSRGVFAFFAKVATPWAAFWVPDVSVSLTASAPPLPFDEGRERFALRVRLALERLCDVLLERVREFEDARRRDALAFVWAMVASFGRIPFPTFGYPPSAQIIEASASRAMRLSALPLMMLVGVLRVQAGSEEPLSVNEPLLFRPIHRGVIAQKRGSIASP